MQSSTLSMMQKVELLKKVADDPKLPSLPSVVLNVLEQASRPDCTINDLCKIIQMDPGLAANILRVVNSATFGLSRPVTSIQRALTVVGLNSARLLVLTISFPKMYQSLKLDPVWESHYWKSSIIGAIVARELSLQMKYRDSEDNMAAGLLRDLGEFILQQMFPAGHAELAEETEEALVFQQCQVEEKHFGLDHAEVGAFILNRWRLPVEITEAVRYHHDPRQGPYTTPTAEDRAYLLHFATRSAQFLMNPERLNLYQDLVELGKHRYGMNDTELQDFLGALSDKTSDFASLLRVNIGEVSDWGETVARAGGALENLALTMNQDNQRAADKTRRAESDARRWQREAAFDPLTKLFNRRFLENRMRELFERRAKEKLAFGLLFIDLDGFKKLNDRFGHPFGDLVLRQVADCLAGTVRQDDVVARYGGDEFCILSDTVDAHTIQLLGKRVWEKINELTFRQEQREGTVGASIGVVYCDAVSKWTTPEELLAAADGAMYAAKAGGKNRIVVLGSMQEVVKPTT